MKIPTRTLYYVLCYAWQRLDYVTQKAAEVEDTTGDDLPQNLLASLLLNSFARVRRRGLDQGYVEHEEDTRRPRGKIDLAGTAQRALRARAQIAVRYEELTADVLQNRLVKTTMLRLAALPKRELDDGLRSKLARSARLMPQVAEVELRDELFRRVRIHRNNADYAFLLSVCRLVSGRLFLEGESGIVRFRHFDADDREMGKLFEAFVFGFLRLERPELRVVREKSISWNAVRREGPQIPGMRADLFVPARGGRGAIVECKCEKDPLDRDGATLKSRHLYQLWAYLTNYTRTQPEQPAPLGVLLYATDGRSFGGKYEFPGHPLRVRSLDLAKAWPGLRLDLLRFADELAESATNTEVRSAA